MLDPGAGLPETGPVETGAPDLGGDPRPARRRHRLPLFADGASRAGLTTDRGAIRSGPHALSSRGTAPPIAPRSVRLSLTDRCDFACVYCRPSRDDGYVDAKLDLDGWRAMIDGLVASGVRRFRLTGGEPLLVRHVVDVVRHLALRGASDVALTTNGSRLEKLAGPLRDAGLMRINVSIDTLDPVRFAEVTRGGRLDAVLRGIDAARDAGFDPIKLNVVVLRGVNDDELEEIVRFSHARGLVPRFLEVMSIGEGARLPAAQLVTVAEMRTRLAHLLVDDEAVGEPDRGPARYVATRSDPRHRVGFISGTSDTYCATCDRLRVSSTGVLRPCLATDAGVDATAALADPSAPDAFARTLAEAWSMKPDGQTFKGCTEPSARDVSMRAIGG